MPHGQELSVPVCWPRELVPGLPVVSQRGNRSLVSGSPCAQDGQERMVSLWRWSLMAWS